MYPIHSRISAETLIYPDGDLFESRPLFSSPEKSDEERARQADEQMLPVSRALYNRNHAEEALARRIRSAKPLTNTMFPRLW